MARQNFGGFGGGANMQQLMRQAQKMQQQMQEARSSWMLRNTKRPPAAAWFP